MKTKIFITLLALIVVLTGCGQPNLNRECIYSKTKDYESELPLDMPLFYSKLGNYEYNGVELDGFYLIGEAEGSTTAFEFSGSPRVETFLVNDKYNIFTSIDISNLEVGEINSLYDERLDKSFIDKMIEDDIIYSLFYEYYEDYFEELNDFLEVNNVKSFWDMDQMECGRSASLSSLSLFPLSHPNLSEYMSFSFAWILNHTQKNIISNAIEDDNLSIKTNLELNLLIEELIDMEGIHFLGIFITIAGEKSSYEEFSSTFDYKSNLEENLDLHMLMEEVASQLIVDDVLKGEVFEKRIYYLYYENGVQISEEKVRLKE